MARLQKIAFSRSKRTRSSHKRIILNGIRQNMSSASIARMMNFKPGRVRMIKHRNKPENFLPPKPKVHKRLTDGRVGLAIKRMISENGNLTANKIIAKLKDEIKDGTPIPSKRTVCRFLQVNGYIIRVLKRKTMLRPQNVQKRLEWAKKHVNKDASYWDRIIWSDETTIQAIPSKKQVLFRAHKSVESKDLPSVPVAQGGGFSVMFWGCFSVLGRGELVALTETVNSETYCDTLEKYLMPDLNFIRNVLKKDMLFMQDNARPHTAKATVEFLKKHKVKVLEWPPQSPDMNPIENIWAWIKRRRDEKFPHFPKNRDELIEQVFSIWEELDDEWFIPYARSVGRRVEAVLKAKGGNTKY